MALDNQISSNTSTSRFDDHFENDVRYASTGAYINTPPVAQRPPDFHNLFGDAPKPEIEDYRNIDNFQPDYADNPKVAQALHDLATYNHDKLMADTPELRDKLSTLADALGITPQQALDNHRKVRDYMALAGRLPEQPLVGPDYLASKNVLASGKILDHYIEDGLHPAFAGLISQSIGLTGPGLTSLDLSRQTFDIKPDDGFFTRAAKHIGNFFAGGIGDHSVIHDTLGMLYSDHRVGPGYTYATGAIPPPQNYTTGQVSGTLSSFGRKAVDGLKSLGNTISDMAGSAFGAIKSGISAGISFLGLDKPRTHQVYGNILEQRDMAMFGKPGQSLSDFREQQAQAGQGIKDFAGGVIDSVKDFGSDIADFGKDAIDSVKDFGKSVVDGAKDFGKSIKDTVSSTFSSISDALGFGGNDDKDTGGGSNNSGGGNDNNGGGSSGSGSSAPSNPGSDLPDSF